jgi:hypothetical protein
MPVVVIEYSICAAYSLGVLLGKNLLDQFDPGNTKHPFLKIACKKGCYKKALRHHADMSVNEQKDKKKCIKMYYLGLLLVSYPIHSNKLRIQNNLIQVFSTSSSPSPNVSIQIYIPI